jgi:hypothetical protein
VAKHGFGKTDVRYWCDAIFKPEYRRDGQKLKVEAWAARMQWRGRRETFNLKTPNKTAAAGKAKEIYTMLVGAGWDATLEKFKPEMARKSVSTVGDFLTELRGHWSGKPKTFEDYCRSFRHILSEIFQIKGGRERFDYVNGGRAAWIQLSTLVVSRFRMPPQVTTARHADFMRVMRLAARESLRACDRMGAGLCDRAS